MTKTQETKIGFDLDGVIINHTQNKIRLAKKIGIKLKPAQTHSEIIKNYIPKDELRKLQKILYDDRILSLQSSVMVGARLVIAKITRLKIPYFLISRRKNIKTAVSLMRQYQLWPQYFNKNNCFFVAEPEDKNKIAAQLGITHYIDDQSKVLEKLVDVQNKFLFDKYGVILSADNYIKVKSWKEFYHLLIKEK